MASRVTQLNSLVSHLPTTWNQNAVDLAYAGAANAQMAMPYLSTSKQSSLRSAWSNYLWKGFTIPVNGQYDPSYTGPKAWNEVTEPFTNQKYLWTYKIDGPAPNNYPLDLEWGIMLPLYGMQKYAQYTGDWAFVSSRWGEVRGAIYKYVDLGDDWAWMTCVNGDMGYSTGTGDPMTANYCGTAACLKMARALGQTADEDYFAYKTARTAVPAVARLWFTDWARNDISHIGANAVVLGFWEKGSVVPGVMDDESSDPWDPTNLLSGDGVLPEMYQAMNACAPGALRTYEREFAAAYPDWANASHAYSFATTYDGNSVYVTYPHIFLRSMLGDDSDAQLWGYVDSAFETQSSAYFVGPNVMAELLSRNAPLRLTEWRPAAYKDGYVDASVANRVILDFTLPAASTSWTLAADVIPTLAPSSVLLGGSAKPFHFDPQTHKLTLTTMVSGTIRLQIDCRDFSDVGNQWIAQ